MIELQITSGSYDLAADERRRIEDRIGGLDEFMNRLQQGHVTVAWEGGPNEQTTIRAQVWGGGHRFEASATDWKLQTAIDQAREELETQISRKRSKERERRR